VVHVMLSRDEMSSCCPFSRQRLSLLQHVLHRRVLQVRRIKATGCANVDGVLIKGRDRRMLTGALCLPSKPQMPSAPRERVSPCPSWALFKPKPKRPCKLRRGRAIHALRPEARYAFVMATVRRC
jgi:hypothetical protein